MATAQMALATEKSIDSHVYKRIPGIILPAAATVGVQANTGTLTFILSGLAEDLADGSSVAVAQGSDSATGMTTIYTVPEGKKGILALTVNNVGGTAGTFSVEVTAEEVEGGGGGA